MSAIIKMTKTAAGPDGCFTAHDEYQVGRAGPFGVTEDAAVEFVAAGAAEYVGAPSDRFKKRIAEAKQ